MTASTINTAARDTTTKTRGLVRSIRGPGGEYRVTDGDGTVRYYLYEGGPLHRAGGPAVENVATGSREYWLNGDRHRDDGPAVERPGRTEYWRFNLLHRETGPAVITATEEFWYRLGYPSEPPHPVASNPPADDGMNYAASPSPNGG
jgi:hypothetical protein